MLCTGWSFIRTRSQFQRLGLLMAGLPQALILHKATAAYICSCLIHDDSALRASANRLPASPGAVLPEPVCNEVHISLFLYFMFPFLLQLGIILLFKMMSVGRLSFTRVSF